MSEDIIIALITAIGSLLAGIIGQMIAASATVKAAAIKEKVNQEPLPSSSERNNKKGNRFWGFLGGALIVDIFVSP